MDLQSRNTHSRDAVEANFIGEKGERSELARELMGYIADRYLERRGPPPPGAGHPNSRREALITAFAETLDALLLRLEHSLPLHSPRYLAHQLGDASLPALVGAITGLLFSSNNVSTESGYETTKIELEVCDKLIEMVGFDPAHAFCHLTSGGTLANVEGLWAARETLYLPLSIQEAARMLGLGVTIDGSDVRTMSPRALLRLAPASKLDLLAALHKAVHDKRTDLTTRVRDLAIGGVPLGADPTTSELLEVALRGTSRNRWNGHGDAFTTYPPVVLVAETAHYSIEKAVNLLGIGLDNVEWLPVDRCFRIARSTLEATLDRVEDEGRFPMAVVPIAGTTQEGAVDPVHEVVDLRRYRKGKAKFWIHVDAAWGGYLRIAPKGDLLRAARAALDAISAADSITVDPHKLGYLPYPCGAIAFADTRVRFLTRQHAPYITKGTGGGDQLVAPMRAADGTPESLGQYVLEGSRSAFPALALSLSTALMPLTAAGHGAVVGATATRARKLHRALSGAPVPGGTLVSLLPEGPDTNLLLFGIKPLANKPWTGISEHNAAVKAIFDRCSAPAPASGFYLSKTIYRRPQFRQEAIDRLADRVGVAKGATEVYALRMSVLNPYLAAMPDDDFEMFAASLKAALTGPA